MTKITKLHKGVRASRVKQEMTRENESVNKGKAQTGMIDVDCVFVV